MKCSQIDAMPTIPTKTKQASNFKLQTARRFKFNPNKQTNKPDTLQTNKQKGFFKPGLVCVFVCLCVEQQSLGQIVCNYISKRTYTQTHLQRTNGSTCNYKTGTNFILNLHAFHLTLSFANKLRALIMWPQAACVLINLPFVNSACNMMLEDDHEAHLARKIASYTECKFSCSQINTQTQVDAYTHTHKLK